MNLYMSVKKRVQNERIFLICSLKLPRSNYLFRVFNRNSIMNRFRIQQSKIKISLNLSKSTSWGISLRGYPHKSLRGCYLCCGFNYISLMFLIKLNTLEIQLIYSLTCFLNRPDGWKPAEVANFHDPFLKI